ncbi:MAG TPA: hypothetical protein VKQ72_01665, partial [Aggregatilineales bacterium]|nr:hypothetical protein [Aggregatilineales bacterium]
MDLLLILIVILAIGAVLLLLSGIRVVPNNRVGIVEKILSKKGSVKEGFIALAGEAGYQPKVLRGGWHILMPFQFRVHIAPLVTIPQGQIGYIFARDGYPLPPAQTLAGVVPEGKSFQDAEGFLKHGGQRGPQREILREGTYAINLAQFVVLTETGLYYLSMGRDEESTFRTMAQVIRDRGGFQPIVIQGTD